jgi:hypothetical protein
MLTFYCIAQYPNLACQQMATLLVVARLLQNPIGVAATQRE